MFPSIMEFLCWCIRQMFPERKPLHEELNAFNSGAVKETCVIIGVKVV